MSLIHKGNTVKITITNFKDLQCLQLEKALVVPTYYLCATMSWALNHDHSLCGVVYFHMPKAPQCLEGND